MKAVGALLVAACVAVYLPVARYAFLSFDDPGYVFDNPAVRAGLAWKGVAWAFRSFVEANWTPLTWISHMATAEIFGVAGRALGLPASGWHHLVNLTLHAGNAVLLFVLLRTITGATWRCACVAALFAVHPLNVEAVAWVSSRKDVLSTCLGLAALLAYVRYARAPSRARYVQTGVWLTLGLLAKPMLVSWPVVMLLLDFWPLGRARRTPDGRIPWKRLLVEKLPFAAIAAGSCFMTMLAHRSVLPSAPSAPFGLRVQNALVQYATYVVEAFWPTDLAVIYPYPGRISAGVTLAAAAFLAVVTLSVLLARRRLPYAAFGWLWFLATLAPVIGLAQVALHARADRYAYVPLIGLFVAVVWAAAEAGARLRAPRWVSSALGVAVLASCAAAGAHQVAYWTDTVTLFRHTCAVTRGNGWAHRILGTALAGEGRNAEAIPEYVEALRVWPEDPIARNNLGCALEAERRLGEAIEEYRQAVRLDPKSATYRRNLAAALEKGSSRAPSESRSRPSPP